MAEYWNVWMKSLPKKKGQKQDMKLLLKSIQMKYGYKIPISKNQFNYIFKTNNIKGIESRFIDVAHGKKLKKVM